MGGPGVSGCLVSFFFSKEGCFHQFSCVHPFEMVCPNSLDSDLVGAVCPVVFLMVSRRC